MLSPRPRSRIHTIDSRFRGNDKIEEIIMEEDLLKIKNDAVSLIMETENAKELEHIHLSFLGKSGSLTQLIKDIGKLPEDKRPEIGLLANEIKQTLDELIQDKKLKTASDSKAGRTVGKLDITLPGNTPPLGHLHLVTQAIEEITAIFEKIGFYRVRYPEVEWDHYAFGALNFPENHPARDDWETFFVDTPTDKNYGPMILTPHTSSGQVREMERVIQNSENVKLNKEGLVTDGLTSIKMLNIAKCYRRQSDVSHTPMFHQFETLCVGKDISITHLKGVLDFFVKSFFGLKRNARIRPYQFQFTEPSFETDVSCGVCNGTGYVIPGLTRNLYRDPESSSGRHKNNSEKMVCRLCKGGWLELGGAGMVHPNVLRAGGIDPNVYTGFASGWGVERVLMMREGLEIDDLRTLYSNDLDFLKQF